MSIQWLHLRVEIHAFGQIIETSCMISTALSFVLRFTTCVVEKKPLKNCRFKDNCATMISLEMNQQMTHEKDFLTCTINDPKKFVSLYMLGGPRH